MESAVSEPPVSLGVALDWALGELEARLFFPWSLAQTLRIPRSEARAAFRERLYPAGGLPAVLYALARLSAPNTVVESGVSHRRSSMALLQALRGNHRGRLISIDLPNARRSGDGSSLPPGLGAGFMVPAYLRERWEPRLGDARQLLPGVLEAAGALDMFVHDSDHSFEHHSYEYNLA